MNATQIQTEIRNGDLTVEDLILISSLCNHLKSKAQVEFTAALKIGDTVVFNNNVNPRYLKGVEALVTKLNPQSIRVQVTDPKAGRFQGNIRSHRSLVDLVSEKQTA